MLVLRNCSVLFLLVVVCCAAESTESNEAAEAGLNLTEFQINATIKLTSVINNLIQTSDNVRKIRVCFFEYSC